MDDITQDKLRKLNIPTVSMKSHQVHLKQALLAASYPQNTITKTRWSNLMQRVSKPKFIMSGATMVIAIVAVVAFSVFTTLRPVSAEQLTQQSLTKVSQLTPTQEQELAIQVNANPESELQAAKNAKDLQILTYQQFRQLQPQASTISINAPNGGAPGPTSLDPASLKYLKYTTADGATHIIGVGKDGLPVLIMSFKQNSDGSSEGSVQVQAGASGQMTTGVGGQAGPGAAGPAGMTACSSAEDGKVSCTNSDGSAAPAPNCQNLGNGEVTCSSSATAQTTKP